MKIGYIAIWAINMRKYECDSLNTSKLRILSTSIKMAVSYMTIMNKCRSLLHKTDYRE